MELDRLEIFLSILVFTTGVLHLYQGLRVDYFQLTLAGIGFLGGLALFMYGFRRKDLALMVMPFTGYQIYMYYIIYRFNFSDLALIDKTVQVLILVFATVYLMREEYLNNLIQKF